MPSHYQKNSGNLLKRFIGIGGFGGIGAAFEREAAAIQKPHTEAEEKAFAARGRAAFERGKAERRVAALNVTTPVLPNTEPEGSGEIVKEMRRRVLFERMFSPGTAKPHRTKR